MDASKKSYARLSLLKFFLVLVYLVEANKKNLHLVEEKSLFG